MLFNLLLVRIAILLCFFFLFFVVFHTFNMIPVETEDARLKLAFIFPTGAPMTIANDVADETICYR